MRRLLIGILCAICVSLASPAIAKRGEPASNPTVTIKGFTVEAARALAAKICVDAGAVIEVNSETQVICAMPLASNKRGWAYRILLTQPGSTDPQDKLRFNFIKNEDSLTFAMDEFIEHQNAMGQVTRTPLTGDYAKLQIALDGYKKRTEAKYASQLVGPRNTNQQSTTPGNDGSGITPELAAQHLALDHGCDTLLKELSVEGDRKLFELKCPAGKYLLVECLAGSCRTLE
jgi:hypothetical protein